tara:strand:- start:64 stop:762 length:699 start_codon:yes stop_codon:yes gene_type:complete
MSVPLFNKILENNQLVNGRLNANLSDLEKLYRLLLRDSDKLQRKQIRQEDLIKSAILKRNETKFLIKRNSESVQKSFFPTSEKISLLYKKMGDAFYIKARFYWEGKQREVQVGSILNVLNIINTMISKNMLDGLKPIKLTKITWQEIQKKPNLINGIKEVASIKSQEYILRKLINEKLNNSRINEIQDLDNNIKNTQKDSPQSSKEYHNENSGFSDLHEDENWYDRWRKDNL